MFSLGPWGNQIVKTDGPMYKTRDTEKMISFPLIVKPGFKNDYQIVMEFWEDSDKDIMYENFFAANQSSNDVNNMKTLSVHLS